MNATKLLEFFDERRDRGDPMVLATVYETQGSTYSKAGALMLIDENGVFRGMLSGGCLEGDLAVRAKVVIESEVAQSVTYDLAQDDELWGMGVGCDGLMRVCLLPLLAAKAYAPFSDIASILRGHLPGEVRIPAATEEGDDIRIEIEPPPRLLILGAGLDAEPVLRIAAELGWRCTVFDHRPAYIEAGHFEAAERSVSAPADDLGETLELSIFDMAIIMSHHLASDRSYLRQLSGIDLIYLGLLGPVHRRVRLLSELGLDAAPLADKIHGPAGLDLGGRGPGPIALSIIAEMQQALNSR